jgi:hypothetical protein
LVSHGQYLLVTCGGIDPADFKKGVPSSKCMVVDSNWCSFVEFEGKVDPKIGKDQFAI